MLTYVFYLFIYLLIYLFIYLFIYLLQISIQVIPLKSNVYIYTINKIYFFRKCLV